MNKKEKPKKKMFKKVFGNEQISYDEWVRINAELNYEEFPEYEEEPDETEELNFDRE